MSFSKAFSRATTHFLAYLAIYGAAVALLRYHPYFVGLLGDASQQLFLALLIGFAVCGFPYFFLRFTRPSYTERAYRDERLIVIGRGIAALRTRTFGEMTVEARAAFRTACLSFLVKMFFFPLMVNFFFTHATALIDIIRAADPTVSPLAFFWRTGYHALFNFIFVIDTAIFAAAYIFEFSFLGNRIRSVDPHVSGWLVALICYPPWNDAAGHIIPLTKEMLWLTPDSPLDYALRIAMFVAFAIYVSATVALGWRSGNLVNRGIVARGPYRFIRHPAYIAKNLAWWFEYLPYLTPMLAVSLLAWNAIYFLRAITEERHLNVDPAYRAYAKKVRYRFIPGVW